MRYCDGIVILGSIVQVYPLTYMVCEILNRYEYNSQVGSLRIVEAW